MSGITIEKHYTIRCGACKKKTATTVAATVGAARMAFAEQGWVESGGKAKCPDCKPQQTMEQRQERRTQRERALCARAELLQWAENKWTIAIDGKPTAAVITLKEGAYAPWGLVYEPQIPPECGFGFLTRQQAVVYAVDTYDQKRKKGVANG